MRTNNEIREKIVKMYLEGYSVARIMDSIGIKSSRTIYKVLNEAGVTSTERQEREADVINVTITDENVVRWLRSQPNASEAITKLVYSQIEGSSEKQNTQEQNPRIADSSVIVTDVVFYDINHSTLGGDRITSTEALLPDIIYALRDSKYPQASEALYDGCKNRIVF